MKLSLLTPPRESPRDVPHVPIPQGWPGEREIAISTAGLPRQLPLVTMNPEILTGPYEAMSRFGNTVTAVGAQTLGIVLEAEARKRNAKDLSQAEILYSGAADRIDRGMKELQATETHETFLPKYDELVAQNFQQALNASPNDAVRAEVGQRLAKFRVTKGAQATDIERTKTVNFHEGVLTQSTINYVNRASDPTLSPKERELAAADLVGVYVKAAHIGWADPDKLVKDLNKSIETIATRNASSAMTNDPLGFFESGWKEFQGQMPADDLTKMRETARNMYYGRESDKANFKNAQDKTFTENEKIRMVKEATELEERLQGIKGPPPTDAELEEHIKRFQYVREPKDTEYWMTRRAKLIKDGPVNPRAYRERLYDLYTGKANLATVQQDRMDRRMSTGETDDLAKIAIAMTERSSIPNYESGKRQVTERLGLTMLDWLSGTVPMFRPADQAKLRGIMADALAEYEMRLQSYKGDPVTLGEEIGKRYFDTQMQPILGGMVQGVDTPPTSGGPGGGKGKPTPGASIGEFFDSVKKKLGIGN